MWRKGERSDSAQGLFHGAFSFCFMFKCGPDFNKEAIGKQMTASFEGRK